MVEQQKMEQRGQAVKRLRSLFDMHHIPFGALENLGGLLLNLHENRHFAMDFWAVVNSLSEGGSGTLTDEEMLEVVVEGIAGVSSHAVPEYERPGIHELRQMLAGVDVTRPAALPAPIAEPGDALLPRRDATRFSGVASPAENDEALQRRRSIGESLAKLEQSTRDLREQLAQIDAQIAGSQPGTSPLPETSRAEVRPPEAQQTEPLGRWSRMADTPKREVDLEALAGLDALDGLEGLEPTPPESGRVIRDPESSPLAEVVPPQGAARLANEPRVQPAAVVEKPLHVPAISALARDASIAAAAAPAERTVVTPAAAVPPQPPAERTPVVPIAAEREVFTRRPTHTLLQRGLALPDPDDDPSIIAPLSAYAAEGERSPGRRWVIVAAVVAVLAVAGFFGSRTEAGQAMLQQARTAIHDKYNSLTGHSASTTTAAAPAASPVEQPNPVGQSSPTAQSNPVAQGSQGTNPDAAKASESTAQPQQQANPTPAGAPAAPPSAATSAAPHTPAEAPLRPKEPFVDGSVLRVPQSAMAANLITSRVPAYPESALAQEIEGPVVMDVVISDTGVVRYVHVIDGDRHLRAAAEDAVMRFRYKPYLLNGSPVEVTTTVRVDFRLPR